MLLWIWSSDDRLTLIDDVMSFTALSLGRPTPAASVCTANGEHNKRIETRHSPPNNLDQKPGRVEPFHCIEQEGGQRSQARGAFFQSGPATVSSDVAAVALASNLCGSQGIFHQSAPISMVFAGRRKCCHTKAHETIFGSVSPWR